MIFNCAICTVDVFKYAGKENSFCVVKGLNSNQTQLKSIISALESSSGEVVSKNKMKKIKRGIKQPNIPDSITNSISETVPDTVPETKSEVETDNEQEETFGVVTLCIECCLGKEYAESTGCSNANRKELPSVLPKYVLLTYYGRCYGKKSNSNDPCDNMAIIPRGFCQDCIGRGFIGSYQISTKKCPQEELFLIPVPIYFDYKALYNDCIVKDCKSCQYTSGFCHEHYIE